MKRFDGKVAVITGGNSGIGYAAATRLRDEGASVVIVGRNEAKVTAVADDLGVVGLTADVTDIGQLETAMAAVKLRFDRIDVLFANAGVAFFAPSAETTPEFFDSISNTNVRGLFFTIQKSLPLLAPGASIVINTSVVNELGLPGSSVYSASKAAARSLVRTLAAELAGSGIRVNAVSPGPIETPIFSKTGMPAEALEGFAKELLSRVPLGRFGQASEVASAVAFLASDDASFVTGAELPVDGGFAQV